MGKGLTREREEGGRRLAEGVNYEFGITIFLATKASLRVALLKYQREDQFI